MSYDDFRELIKTMVEERLGNQFKITINKVNKLNGLQLYGLTIRTDSSNISPTIYLEDFYSDYSDDRDLGDIVDSIISIYNENKIDSPVEFNWFKDFDNVESKVIFRLINTSKNLEMLNDMPSIPYLDLSIIFAIQIEDNAVINVKNEHLKMWNISIDDLYQVAKRNTPMLCPAKLMSIDETLAELDSSFEGLEFSQLPMYVLSNATTLYGASVLLYYDISTHFNTDLFIIPSSLHECILLPANSRDEADGIRQIIGEVNKEMNPADVLSDNLYFYSHEQKEITMI